MIFSRRKLGVVVTVLLVLAALLLAACAVESDHLGPTTTTTIFPSQHSFEEELSGDGYGPPFLFIDGTGAARSLFVWIPVDTGNETRATNDAIFDHAVSLAQSYEAARSTGGRMTVGLFDYRGGGSVKDNIFESRDFDLSKGVQTSSTAALPNRDAIIARATVQVQEALGLPSGSVTVSDKAAGLPDAEVLLSCDGGGEAALDLDTGRVVYLIAGPGNPDSGIYLPAEELDAKAVRLAEIMGWDAAALAAEGFTLKEAEFIDHGDAATEYTKRWGGHDEQGIPNNGLIDAAVDAGTGQVLHFFYHPGPRASLDQSATITDEEAVRIAKAYLESESWPSSTSMSSAPARGTNLLSMQSAALVHTDAPGITGGREMLVWIVKLGGMTERGEATATVYLDAVTGKVLTWTTAG